MIRIRAIPPYLLPQIEHQDIFFSLPYVAGTEVILVHELVGRRGAHVLKDGRGKKREEVFSHLACPLLLGASAYIFVARQTTRPFLALTNLLRQRANARNVSLQNSHGAVAPHCVPHAERFTITFCPVVQ